MDLYHKLKWGNRIFYSFYFILNFSCAIYNISYTEYCYRYIIHTLLSYRALTLIQYDIKYIYYLIWSRLTIYPIIIIYDIYKNGFTYKFHILFMLIEMLFNRIISRIEFGSNNMGSYLIPLYYGILLENIEFTLNNRTFILQGIFYCFFSFYLFIYGTVYTNGYYFLLGIQYITVGIDGLPQFLIDSSIIERIIIIPFIITITGLKEHMYDDLFLSLFMGGYLFLINSNINVMDYFCELFIGHEDDELIQY